MKHVHVGDLEIGFRRAGDGPALVLLHGAVCDSRVWSRALGALADELTVVAWDAPGCGQSSDPPERFGMRDYAESLAAFVDALGLGRAHVLGHSWGSTLALELCVRRPSLVRSLILVGAYAGWAGSLAPDEVDRRLAFALSTADAVESGAWDPRSMPGLFSDAMPPEQAEELAAIMSEIRPTGTRIMARALAESDLRPVLGEVTAPTLLVHGGADARSPLPVARELARAIPDCSLTLLAGLGHECYLEDPAAFEAAVRRFLHAVDANAPDERR